MSQKEGARDGRALRTAARTSCSRVSSWAATRARTLSRTSRTRSGAVGSVRGSSTVSSSASEGEAGVGVDAEGRVVGLQLAEVGLDLDHPAAGVNVW